MKVDFGGGGTQSALISVICFCLQPVSTVTLCYYNYKMMQS